MTTNGQGTYVSCRTSLSAPSFFVPVKSFPSMSRGSPKDPLNQHLGVKLQPLSRLKLNSAASGRSSRRRWPSLEGGFPDRQGRQPGSEFHHQPSTTGSKP